MTGYTGTTENPFQERLVECVADICELMPDLRARYDMTVVMGAMAEHVGAAMNVFLSRSLCEKEAARKLVAIVENAAASAQAARPQTTQPASSAPPATAAAMPAKDPAHAPCATTPPTGAAAAGTPTTPRASADGAPADGEARQNSTRH